MDPVIHSTECLQVDGMLERSSKSQGVILPIELCERIIDICALAPLASTGQAFERFKSRAITPQRPSVRFDLLRACALTCRGWRPRSQYHLFHDIHIRTKADLTSLVSILRCNLKIRNCIKFLRLELDSPSAAFLLLQGQMPNLQELQVFAYTGHVFTISLHASSFAALKTFAHIKKLRLSEAYSNSTGLSLIRLLSLLPNLTHLQVDTMDEGSVTSPPRPTFYMPPFQLKSLIIGTCDKPLGTLAMLLAWLLKRPSAIDSLQTLWLDLGIPCDEEILEDGEVHKMLPYTGSSLQELGISHHSWSSDEKTQCIPNNLNLSCMQKLQCLHFMGIMPQEMESICRLLSTMTHPSLKRLNIEIYSNDDEQNISWAKLDEVLSSKVFQGLQTMNIRDHDIGAYKVVQDLDKKLPKLHLLGVLKQQSVKETTIHGSWGFTELYSDS
ncbi:unnamed protein product [Somion occarium]|uniref:F-box domain-containing protein n=1 Tax=Somion occarium TaxID=3059160 RepID=A0ABP1DR61_9APHY